MIGFLWGLIQCKIISLASDLFRSHFFSSRFILLAKLFELYTPSCMVSMQLQVSYYTNGTVSVLYCIKTFMKLTFICHSRLFILTIYAFFLIQEDAKSISGMRSGDNVVHFKSLKSYARPRCLNSNS